MEGCYVHSTTISNAKSLCKNSDKSGKLELTNIVFVEMCHSVVAHDVKSSI